MLVITSSFSRKHFAFLHCISGAACRYLLEKSRSVEVVSNPKTMHVRRLNKKNRQALHQDCILGEPFIVGVFTMNFQFRGFRAAIKFPRYNLLAYISFS